jgi:acetyl esterase
MTYRFDPELAAAVPMLAAPDLTDLAQTRAFIAEFRPSSPPDTTGLQVHDLRISGPLDAPEVAVRVYRPASQSGQVAALLNIHGGGFVLGSVDLEDANCVQLARTLGVVVVSVEYRLAPEHVFPAALEDCYTALEWLSKKTVEYGIDPTRIAVHGISAGAGLAAALALLTRDRGGPPLCFQFLGLPELDDRLDTPSMQRFIDTPLWNRPNAIISWNSYLGEGIPGTPDVSPYAAPARANDLTGLPAAYISVMEFDPLRDEGIAYAHALLAAGVPVELHLFPGAFHGSAVVAHAAISRRQNTETISVLTAALGVAHSAPT